MQQFGLIPFWLEQKGIGSVLKSSTDNEINHEIQISQQTADWFDGLTEKSYKPQETWSFGTFLHSALNYVPLFSIYGSFFPQWMEWYIFVFDKTCWDLADQVCFLEIVLNATNMKRHKKKSVLDETQSCKSCVLLT